MADRITELPGQDTLCAYWRALARTSPGARVVQTASVVAAVFPAWTPLNNAITRDAEVGADTSAAEARTLFEDAGVKTWALWLPSRATDFETPDAITAVAGLERDATTLVMTVTLARDLPQHEAVVPVSLATVAQFEDEPLPPSDPGSSETTPGLSAWGLVHEGVVGACAYSYLHHHDCGIYGVGTAARWRRMGFATALAQHVLADAQARGATTASLQSALTAQRVYERLGFVPIGRYEEWIVR